jgi:hypothetical protein
MPLHKGDDMNLPGVSILAKITRMAAAEGVTVEAKISALIEETQSLTRVAWMLGVTPNTIRYHAIRFGYTYDPEKRRWNKPN